MNKMSFRFYKDHEVRAIWDEENFKWWFSIVDIVAAITESPRPRVYWGTVKNRQKEEHSQLYSKCIQLKLTSADGKKYAVLFGRAPSLVSPERRADAGDNLR